MNTYFAAIQQATNNGKFPDLSDCWRCFHPTALMLDSDYCLFSDTGRFSTTRYEEEKPAKVSPKILYVPVTRKVSPRTWTKPSISPCKVILTGENKSQKLH